MVLVATGNRNQRDIRNVQTVFDITNWSEDSTLDYDSTSDGELADILGQVIKRLIEQGILNGTVNT